MSTDTTGLRELLTRDPANTMLYFDALDYCRQSRKGYEAAEYLDGQRKEACQIQEPPILLESLIRHGGLARTLYVDGKPYGGTLQDLQADESISDDAELEQTLETTEAGVAFLTHEGPDTMLGQLFETDPENMEGFKLVLRSCDTQEGKTTAELQEILRSAGVLPCDERTGVELIHASYFTGALENVGALEWNGRRWLTNERGSAASS